MTTADDEQATRVAYDRVAKDYAVVLKDLLAESAMDRAVLGVFAEQVQADGGGPVADLGCGPGRLTGHLRTLGLDVVGVDLSPGMLAVARAAHPDLAVARGSMAALPVAGGRLAGIVAWYSIIHTPPDDHPRLFAEMARTLRPGGQVVVAFQVGNERVHVQQAYGHTISCFAYRLPTESVAEHLETAGFTVTAKVIREPVPPETLPQAYLLARTASE